MYSNFEMIWLKIREQIKDPGFSLILTKGCCMVREWFTLTTDNLISWMTVRRGERGEREWQIGNWQVITAQCVGYLRQFIDLYIYLYCSLQCNPYINLQLHIELLLMHLSVIFKTSILNLIQARKHSSLHTSEHRGASTLCICKYMHVISYSLWLIVPRADFQTDVLRLVYSNKVRI